MRPQLWSCWGTPSFVSWFNGNRPESFLIFSPQNCTFRLHEEEPLLIIYFTATCNSSRSLSNTEHAWIKATNWNVVLWRAAQTRFFLLLQFDGEFIFLSEKQKLSLIWIHQSPKFTENDRRFQRSDSFQMSVYSVETLFRTSDFYLTIYNKCFSFWPQEWQLKGFKSICWMTQTLIKMK